MNLKNVYSKICTKFKDYFFGLKWSQHSHICSTVKGFAKRQHKKLHGLASIVIYCTQCISNKHNKVYNILVEG